MSTTVFEKVCVNCEQLKPFSEFYVRSGVTEPMYPGHYNSECKECLKARNKTRVMLPAYQPRFATEVLAIDYLKAHGVFAVPGKAVSAADVDVVAWGAVWVEVKYARLEFERGTYKFTFTATPKQQKRGFLAHIVMLICEYDSKRTYHLFPSSDPVFYMEGGKRVKSGFTFTPGAMEAKKHGQNRVVMVQPMMDSAQDNISLIYDTMGDITRQLLDGVND